MSVDQATAFYVVDVLKPVAPMRFEYVYGGSDYTHISKVNVSSESVQAISPTYLLGICCAVAYR